MFDMSTINSWKFLENYFDPFIGGIIVIKTVRKYLFGSDLGSVHLCNHFLEFRYRAGTRVLQQNHLMHGAGQYEKVPLPFGGVIERA